MVPEVGDHTVHVNVFRIPISRTRIPFLLICPMTRAKGHRFHASQKVMLAVRIAKKAEAICSSVLTMSDSNQ